ncbi:MAG: tRNA pseudouridine(13) synthase TruD [Candidatus Altiarchaeota archaeon]|nr:tRNA pseudouridine(13) synthase TruD [Candidatus Altiarchaeota archaeon]
MELREPAGAVGYLTKGVSTHLTIQEFNVFEVPKFIATKSGPHYWGLLEKNFRNTLDVVREISKELQVQMHDIGYAGLKDKKGKTYQWISSPGPPPLKGRGWQLKIVLKSQKKIKKGNLLGNWFILKTKDIVETKLEAVPNFFGPQRFSTRNHEIGKLLITGEKKEALKIMRDLKIPISRKYFVLMEDAYCSYLFNKILSKRLETPELPGDVITRKGVTGPVFGNKLRLATDKAGELEQNILYEEGLELKDFPGDGRRRPLFIKPIGFEINNKTLKFFLPKGSYATTLLREISKEKGITWDIAHPTFSSFA